MRPFGSAGLRSLLCAIAFGLSLASPAHALDIEYTSTSKLNNVTLAGSHNTYDKKSDFEYLFYALDKVQVIELDVWAAAGKWYVSHSSPLGNVNNCPRAASSAPTATRTCARASTVCAPGTTAIRSMSSSSSRWSSRRACSIRRPASTT